MFWGFVLEPKKRYNTTVTKPFHISMAALDPKSINDDDISSLVLNVDGAETILCNLGKPNYLQERLDLNFIEGNTITLEVKGKATVHLSGYFIYEQDGMEDEDDSDLDDEEELDDDEESDIDAKNLKALKKQLQKKNKFNASTTEDDSDDDEDGESGDDSMDVSDMTFDDDDDEDDDDDDDDEEDEEDEDIEEEEELNIGSPGSTPMPSKGKNKKQAASLNGTPVSSNKKKQQQQQQESGKKNKGSKQEQQSPQKGLTNGSAPNTPSSSKKKQNKGGQENGTSTPGTGNNTPGKQGGTPTPKKSLEGGVIIEDMKVGGGAPAKFGKMVCVFYVGKLKSNNKQFDSTTSGPGFKFRLGKGEVIKGWDVGLKGMKVGGKRRMTIPAHMAYGNKGSPPAIPPNSTLVFDVELKNVN